MSEGCCDTITLFKGEDGRTIYNGTGAPTLTTANEGDFYIDTSAWEIYGPYSVTGWGTGTSLIGASGAIGPSGAYGGWSSEWTFDSNTGSGPGTSEFRLDNASPSSATKIYIHKTNADSTVMTAFLQAWTTGSLLRLSKNDDTNVFWTGSISTIVENANDFEITVVTTLANGTFTDTDNFVISYIAIGPQGIQGDPGADGIDGTDEGGILHTLFNSTYASGDPDLEFSIDTSQLVNRGDTINVEFLFTAIATSPGDLVFTNAGGDPGTSETLATHSWDLVDDTDALVQIKLVKNILNLEGHLRIIGNPDVFKKYNFTCTNFFGASTSLLKLSAGGPAGDAEINDLIIHVNHAIV